MLGTREGRRQLWRGQSHLIDRVPFAGLRALSVWRLRSAIPTLNPSPSILSIRTKRVGVGQVGFELPAQDEASPPSGSSIYTSSPQNLLATSNILAAGYY